MGVNVLNDSAHNNDTNKCSFYLFYIYLGWADRCRKTREQTKILGERKSNISASIYINCLSVCLFKNVKNLVWITYKTPMGGQWPIKFEQFCPEKMPKIINLKVHPFQSKNSPKFENDWKSLLSTLKLKCENFNIKGDANANA